MLAGQTVDILLDVTNPGLWMAHCHIAEHNQSGMMFSFDVAPRAAVSYGGPSVDRERPGGGVADRTRERSRSRISPGIQRSRKRTATTTLPMSRSGSSISPPRGSEPIRGSSRRSETQ